MFSYNINKKRNRFYSYFYLKRNYFMKIKKYRGSYNCKSLKNKFMKEIHVLTTLPFKRHWRCVVARCRFAPCLLHSLIFFFTIRYCNTIRLQKLLRNSHSKTTSAWFYSEGWLIGILYILIKSYLFIYFYTDLSY